MYKGNETKWMNGDDQKNNAVDFMAQKKRKTKEGLERRSRKRASVTNNEMDRKISGQKNGKELWIQIRHTTNRKTKIEKQENRV